MDFGSAHILFDPFSASEDIYQDEIEDGIAACAEQQAKIWAMAAKEATQNQDQDTDSKSAKFIDSLITLTSSYTSKR